MSMNNLIYNQLMVGVTYNNNLVAQRIKDRRTELGFSQQELGNRMGFSQQSVSFVESQRNEPTARFIFMAAAALEVPIEWLLGLSDEKPPL